MNKLRILSMVLVLVLAGLMVSPAQPATQDQINASIQKGLDWLVSQQQAGGYWSGGSASLVSETAFAVVKLEDRAFELGYSGPFDPAYPYKVNVEKGLNFLFANAQTIGIYAQPAGYPDTNGNGIGVYFGGQSTYDTGIVMMAIAASRAPGLVVNVPGSAVDGCTYKQVLQDAVDYFAWGQTDAPSQARGGWYYSHNQGWSDNSNAGYAVLGLRYAEAALYGFTCDMTAFVKPELNFWINYIQSPDGGSGYGNPGSWENTLKTGNLLGQMAFFGDNTLVPRVQSAINYIKVHWYDLDLIQGWGWNQPSGPAVAQYQAAYCLMKGLESMGVPLNGIPGVANWFQDLADVIVPQQNADGSWPESAAYVSGSYQHMVDKVLSTEWALLTLEKVSPPPPVNVVVDVPDCACDITGYQVKINYTVERFTVNGTLKVSKDGVLVDTVNLVNFTGTATDTRDIASDTPGTHAWNGVLDVTPVGGGTPGHAEGTDSVNVCESPKVAGIPDQIAPFHTFDLDDYLTYGGGLPVIWSASVPPAGWTVAIDGNNVVTVTAPPGAGTPATITFTASVTCCPGLICKGGDDAVFIPNRPPDTSKAVADPGCLWPPDHKFVNVSIKGVTDPDGDPVAITITGITSDEPTASDNGSGGASFAPDATGVGTGTASVRAERSGDGDGRVYVISFTASDGRGGVYQGTVMVKVPHDQSPKDCKAIDSGQKYDATKIN